MGGGRFGRGAPKKPAPTPPEQEPCWVDGAELRAYPYSNTFAAGAAHWLMDNKRTGYYVHPDNPPLRVERRPQAWNYLWRLWAKPNPEFPGNDERNFIVTTGEFAVAWFEHGAKPDAERCVYTLIPETTPTAMAQFAADMSNGTNNAYEILQADAHAHILRDRDSRTTGYIIFDAAWRAPEFSTDHRTLNTEHSLLSANRPCSVMVREAGEGLVLSVSSTDLDEWPSFGYPPGRIMLSGDIVLTLAGTWRVEGVDATKPRECTASHGDGQTIVRIPYKDFMPVHLTLERSGVKKKGA
jgi:hypothetical protein